MKQSQFPIIEVSVRRSKVKMNRRVHLRALETARTRERKREEKSREWAAKRERYETKS